MLYSFEKLNFWTPKTVNSTAVFWLCVTLRMTYWCLLTGRNFNIRNTLVPPCLWLCSPTFLHWPKVFIKKLQFRIYFWNKLPLLSKQLWLHYPKNVQLGRPCSKKLCFPFSPVHCWNLEIVLLFPIGYKNLVLSFFFLFCFTWKKKLS